MNPTAKSLILKAQECINMAGQFLNDPGQHDAAGYNLAQATEFFLKALLSIKELEFPDGSEAHDLDSLVEILEENGFSAISSHADLIDLTPYNSPTAQVRKSERLDLKEYNTKVEDLKKLVGQFL